MISFTLETQNLTHESRKDLIKVLYDSFLSEDDNWHFFYEMERGDVIRVSEFAVDDIAEYLTEKGIKFTTEKWVETYPIVEANKNYFKDMFHMNSLLIVNSDEKQLESIFRNASMLVDRFSHSLHNYLTLFMQTPEGIKSPMQSESRTLAESLVMRATYDGYRTHYLQSTEQSRRALKEQKDGN